MTPAIDLPCCRCGRVAPGEPRPAFYGHRYCPRCYLATVGEMEKEETIDHAGKDSATASPATWW
jgi:hypothetical protein